MSPKEIQDKIISIQVSSLPYEEKKKAIVALESKQCKPYAGALVVSGDISDIASSF